MTTLSKLKSRLLDRKLFLETSILGQDIIYKRQAVHNLFGFLNSAIEHVVKR